MERRGSTGEARTPRPTLKHSASDAAARQHNLLTPTHHVTAIQNNPRPSIFSMIAGDEYESWYDMAADLTSPAASSLEGPRDLTSAEGRAHAQASVAEFSRYLKLIGEPYDAFTANRRDRPAQPQNSEEAAAARIGSEPVSMEEVPVLVFDENFKLEDPSTFAFFSPDGFPASTLLQQERLTHYLDLVEVNLLHAVSTRSEDFYTALDSWQDLTELVRAGVQQIESLRETVRAIDERLARTAFRLPFLCRQRSNQLRLHRQLLLIATIRTAQPTIQALLASEDYVGALELIGSTQAVLRGELAGVRCFTHLDEELGETAKSLTAMMVQDFMTTMSQGVARAVAAGGKGGQPGGGITELEAVRNKLAPLLMGLHRQGALAQGLRGFFESLRGEVRATVKTRVAELLAEGRRTLKHSNGEGGANNISIEDSAGTIADQLLALSTSAFLALLAGVAQSLLQVLAKAELVSSTLSAVIALRPSTKIISKAARAVTAVSKEQGNGFPSHGTVAVAAEGNGKPADLDLAKDTGALAACATQLAGLCELVSERYAKLLSVRAELFVFFAFSRESNFKIPSNRW
mmetsp:Transcript_13000/g.33537  ORF Transcript_13000/g.33537 Transcript_13000/m.33537 type:complete len:576 (+) Transcript_13000:64-1791(+)